MGLLDYFKEKKAQYDRLQEELKKRSILSQLKDVAKAVIPDSIEAKIHQTVDPVLSNMRSFSSNAKDQAVSSGLGALPVVGPVIAPARQAVSLFSNPAVQRGIAQAGPVIAQKSQEFTDTARPILQALPNLALNYIKDTPMRGIREQQAKEQQLRDYIDRTQGTSLGNKILQAPVNPWDSQGPATMSPINWLAQKAAVPLAQGSARAVAALGLTGAELYTGKKYEIPAAPATAGIFGSGYAGEEDGSAGRVTSLTDTLGNIAKGQGFAGGISNWGKEHGISPIISAPLLGIAATLGDVNPIPGDIGDLAKLQKAAKFANEAVDAARAAGKTAEEIKAAAKAAEAATSAYEAARGAVKPAEDALATARRTSEASLPTTRPPKVGSRLPGAAAQKVPGDISSFYNTERLNIPQAGKDAIKSEVKNAQQILEKTVGRTLSNKEVTDLAANTSRVLERTVTREQTAAKIAADLKLRQSIAKASETGTLEPGFIDLWIKDKAAGEDIARQLQARKIGADPKEVSYIDSLLESIYKVNQNADEITKAAKDVDFTDPEQVTKFYRTFVKPKASDWIDTIRYNSMLSSPTTHLVNVMSNFLNTGVLAPIEKTVSGVLDATRSAIFGTERTHFAGEGVEYAKGYYSNLRNASQKFWDSFKSRSFSGNIDTRSIPMALKGTKARAAENVLSVPSRLLEAADQFATALTESGVESSLKYKVGKGARVADVSGSAAEEATYRLYRAKLGGRQEGPVLGALEFIPQKLLEARNSNNPIVRNIAKWSFPFINTGTQLFKQGVEYSPLGISTVIGNERKIEQLSKTIIGTTVALGVASLVADDRITWAEPTDPDLKNAFRASGMQPYAVKIGDTWVSYAKLPPFLAWNFALVAAVKDSNTNKKLSDSQADTVLSIAGKYLNFFADQSYMKQVGSVVDASKGDPFALTNFVASVPQQLIPYRALMGWIERAIDPVQRQADPDGTDLERTFQTIFAQIPGLAQTVPPRMGPDGQPVENQNRILNALSAVKVTKEDPAKAGDYKNILDAVRLNSEESRASADLRTRAEAADKELMQLPADQRAARFNELTANDPKLAAKISDVVDARNLNLTLLDQKIKALEIKNGKRAEFIWQRLQELSTDEQRAAYWADLVTKKIISKEVAKQLQAFMQK